ncbi:RNA polymerase sigma factor, sigma-70 family [Thioflavicoccus mobilis 8321]|uniref:RNA polymerase sigma factor, sigma-70 family n=1 Tax=Thioflavicoccus mobilis 8321 TaxID=765912 RepID=L0GU14_9GAMM|nr:sigma-70 family RNA polymerase sigma factor [Thioflavicoccus mobilis]AGA89307.1 RNA polymerase sigma factor, sigma-70 family [Thioflavicoccus mobilis 8321]
MTDRERLDAQEERLRGWLLRGLDGDAAAYRTFLERLTTHLRGYFRRRLAAWPEEVEDLVQETLLAVHNRRHTYDARQPLTAWAHAIARYKLADLMRRRAPKERLTDRLDALADRGAELLAAADDSAAEAHRDLHKLLAELPDRQRLPIVHTKLEGRSVAETARATGMSESAVKVGVHRGLRALAARIRGER